MPRKSHVTHVAIHTTHADYKFHTCHTYTHTMHTCTHTHTHTHTHARTHTHTTDTHTQVSIQPWPTSWKSKNTSTHCVSAGHQELYRSLWGHWPKRCTYLRQHTTTPTHTRPHPLTPTYPQPPIPHTPSCSSLLFISAPKSCIAWIPLYFSEVITSQNTLRVSKVP